MQVYTTWENIRFAQVEYLLKTRDTESESLKTSHNCCFRKVVQQWRLSSLVLLGAHTAHLMWEFSIGQGARTDDTLTFCSARLSLTPETLRAVINVTQQTFFWLIWGPQKKHFLHKSKNPVWSRHLTCTLLPSFYAFSSSSSVPDDGDDGTRCFRRPPVSGVEERKM